MKNEHVNTGYSGLPYSKCDVIRLYFGAPLGNTENIIFFKLDLEISAKLALLVSVVWMINNRTKKSYQILKIERIIKYIMITI